MNGTVNDLAMCRRPAALADRRLRDRGGLPDRRPAADRRLDGRRRARSGRRRRRRRHEGRRARQGRRALRHDGRCRAPSRTASSSGPRTSGRATASLLSGTLADHGMAVMVARGDLALEAEIESDTAPVHELMAALLELGARFASCAIRPAAASRRRSTSWPKRLGWPSCSTSLRIPVRPAVTAACEILGIDPLYVANEGKLIAVVAPDVGGRRAGPPARTEARRRRRPSSARCAEPRGHGAAGHGTRRLAHRRHARRRSAAAHLLTPRAARRAPG